jgi:hypothetical protein
VETIGDGFMAVGGAPDACSAQEAAERMARVALRMMQVGRAAAAAVVLTCTWLHSAGGTAGWEAL